MSSMNELPDTDELGPGKEEIAVLNWRINSLRLMGFGEDLAIQLAVDFPVDLGEVRKLIGAGCPHEIAARILAPL